MLEGLCSLSLETLRVLHSLSLLFIFTCGLICSKYKPARLLLSESRGSGVLECGVVTSGREIARLAKA